MMLIFLNSWSNITFSFIFPPSLTKKKKRKNKLFLYVSVPDADSEWLQGHKHGSVDGIFSVLQRGTLTVWLLFPKSCLCFCLFISFLYTISMAHMIQLQDHIMVKLLTEFCLYCICMFVYMRMDTLLLCYLRWEENTHAYCPKFEVLL
jgi:hypothetical protein